MDLGLHDRVAVVAGASGELGSAIAGRLTEEGMHLALLGRRLDRLEDLAGRLRRPDQTMVPIPVDTTDQASVEAMARTVRQTFDRCDVLVNAAAPPAMSRPGSGLADTSAEDIRQDFEVKVLGAFRCTQALVPLMLKHGSGAVVTISGLNARRTGSLSGSIRNVALSAMTKNLADELGPRGVRLTVVHPGIVDTVSARARLAGRTGAPAGTSDDALAQAAAGTSLNRLPDPDNIADVVAFLASGRSTAITGDSIAVGGGERGVIFY